MFIASAVSKRDDPCARRRIMTIETLAIRCPDVWDDKRIDPP